MLPEFEVTVKEVTSQATPLTWGATVTRAPSLTIMMMMMKKMMMMNVMIIIKMKLMTLIISAAVS